MADSGLSSSAEPASLPGYLTALNAFGILRKYSASPNSNSHSMPPNSNIAPYHTLYGSLAVQKPDSAQSLTVEDIISLFPNISTFQLAHWFYAGSVQKSLSDRTGLVKGVILAPDFNPNHF
ncbi:hypothetical protein FS749_015342 [Ceratobasidium sp. UAMH 11750]|nr:hypothetical protein FS749_015342 [Ceratobasidium sp. UAMH 11750]